MGVRRPWSLGFIVESGSCPEGSRDHAGNCLPEPGWKLCRVWPPLVCFLATVTPGAPHGSSPLDPWSAKTFAQTLEFIMGKAESEKARASVEEGAVFTLMWQVHVCVHAHRVVCVNCVRLLHTRCLKKHKGEGAVLW